MSERIELLLDETEPFLLTEEVEDDSEDLMSEDVFRDMYHELSCR